MASPRQKLWIFIGMVVVLLLVLGLALISLLFADRIMRWLGETGANVITRLMGLILAALAVQYVLDGARTAFSA
jgi:multiple antibiotic resistance protein